MSRFHTESNGRKTAKVFYEMLWGEYRVMLFIDGEWHAGADYHTNDKADAIATAAAMVRTKPVKAAPLSVRFNMAVQHIAACLMPCGFDVSENAPHTFDSLIAHYEKTGRVLVWNGASGKTIFADSEINFAFRAWHDSKHIAGRHDFSLRGEIAALEMQKEDVRALYDGETADYFCAILDSEIRGQAKYEMAHGGFPLDQAAFTRAYLADSESAIYGDFGISPEGVDS